jgi:hypothetical protein
VLHWRIGVACQASPNGEYPWTLKYGAPHAAGPPKFVPVIPSASTMSFTKLFSDQWNMARRETPTEAVLTTVGERMRVQMIAPFWEALSKLKP